MTYYYIVIKLFHNTICVKTMLNWTHVAAATLKALFSLVCFLTWVNDTAEEVTSKTQPMSI